MRAGFRPRLKAGESQEIPSQPGNDGYPLIQEVIGAEALVSVRLVPEPPRR
jgi:hypothetical protein